MADLQNRKTEEANHNARPLEQILTEFRAARETLLNRVDQLDAPLLARAIPHPVSYTHLIFGLPMHFWRQHGTRCSNSCLVMRRRRRR